MRVRIANSNVILDAASDEPLLETALRASQADYQTLKATLQKAQLDLQAQASQTAADLATARLQADRDQQLLKNGLISHIDAKISTEKGAAIDAFYVHEIEGGKITAPERLRAIERKLRHAIQALERG